MTQDEVIEMARQSGWTDDLLEVSFVLPIIEAFAKLVAAKEREACALEADSWHCYLVGSEIRARGEA